jgi:hypothetical protein
MLPEAAFGSAAEGKPTAGPFAHRPRRTLTLILVVWVLNLFDLAFTISAYTIGNFDELNPIAAHFVHDPVLLTLYKVALVALASVILIRYRHHWFCELGCWTAGGMYLAINLLWLQYYAHLSMI